MNKKVKTVLDALASMPDWELRRRYRNDPSCGIWKAEIERRGISPTEVDWSEA